MQQHELEIQIRPNGKVEIHVKGVKGPDCLKYAEFLEQVLEVQGTRELTSEYYEPPAGIAVHIPEKTTG